MFRLLRLLVCCIPLALTLQAASETFAERVLKQIVSDQRDILVQLEKQGDKTSNDEIQSQLQQICQRYDALLNENKEFAPAYVAYGQLLRQVGMKKEGTALMMRANRIDPNLPIVKNEIGNYLAEEGRPVEAAQYYLSAIDLAPTEPLYHYQFATLLIEGRDDFLKSANWTRPSLDKAMLEGFRQASSLAPKDWRYGYRYGLAFYDVEEPKWETALEFWKTFEGVLAPGLEQQICRLHQARVLGELKRKNEAFAALDSVTMPELAEQKRKVVGILQNPSPTPTPPIPMAR